MKPLLIIDGYNVIGAWEMAEKKRWPVEECRRQLITRLQEYTAYEGCETVLVFDGTHSERRMRSHEDDGNVQVVFTRHAETADQYIERLCDGQPRHRQVRVATNDAVEQTVILGRGATRMAARELLREMAQAREAQRAQMQRQTTIKRNPLMSRLPPEQQAVLERMRRGEAPGDGAGKAGMDCTHR